MRARRLALAASLLLALALASCSGDAPPQAATPEATSTPAPTAIATPEAASTPAPTATPAETGAGGAPVPGAASLAACSNGVAIADPDASEGLVRDCALLLDAKDALRGTTPLDWSASVEIAEWEGVRIHAPRMRGPARLLGPARVTGLDLRGKELTGVIPPQLGYLTGLTSLDLAGNGLAGAIPPELANLAGLTSLDLAGNGLTGAIPPELANLAALEQFLAGGNRLTGTIPDLSRLTMLRRLDLRGNRLAGPIPEWLGGVRELGVLRLDGNRLSGPVPRGIGRLPLLSEVTLAGNALTGCVPSRFEDASGDAASLGLPWCLRYDRLDATGTVAGAGEWAILGGNGEVLTTWEQLRSEAAALRVHQTDAGGTSWASEFGSLSVNDLFEWRKADDCWVRYRVTGEPTPPSGASGRWEFPVEWMTYAATGAGCTGEVGAGAVLSVDGSVSDVIRVFEIASPVRHGSYLVYPSSWDGEREPKTRYEPPSAAADGGASGSADPEGVYTKDLAEARRRIPYWRDPVLPAGWTFSWAESDNGPYGHYEATYKNELGYDGVDIEVYYKAVRPSYSISGGRRVVYEPRVLDGRSALVVYSPQGSGHERLLSTAVWIFDAETGIEYYVRGVDRNMRGSNVEPLIEIARSLLPPPTPAPTAVATPEDASTPAPTAAVTPEATPTPAPTATATPEASSTPAPTATATPEAASMSEATSTPAPTAIATPEASPPPAPTATATPEASPPPAPTATATPEATSTPEPTPEQACANGVAVADPEAHPGLVADCEALLRAKDALRGDASLDWSGGLAVEDWEGVAVSGEPSRVTGLDLRGKGLTGSIPRELRRLRLGEVRLAGNALTGCVPSAFEDASGDAADLGLPWCLRYDRLDATGEVAGAGEWAILDGNGEVLTTWEQLRSEAATLRIHQTDAGGTSWASEFGAVDVNDLFEWRMAGDCWVRYRVTGAPAAPPGASGRWEFPVEWMTYAATGAGCTGAVGTSTVHRILTEMDTIWAEST